MSLKRELGLFSLTLYGIGIILGAGIYALIGVGAGLAGNMLWLAFLVSALIAIFTGLSYAELSGMFPKDAAEYNYTKQAFSNNLLSFLVQWVLLIGLIIGGATVALGFGGYFHSAFGVEQQTAAYWLIVCMMILNYLGIKESATFNNFASIIEVVGLILVVAVVFLLSGSAKEFNLLEMPPNGFNGIFAAISVIFFAYIGFESVANLSEEVKDRRKIVQKALILSLLISTALYILVSIAAVSEVGWKTLSESKAPLTAVVSKTLGNYSVALSFIALFATANTVLVMLVVSSRILYGMANNGTFPKIFSRIGERGTPYYSVLLIGLGTLVAASIGNIRTIAQITDMGIFLAYLVVNLSLIALCSKNNIKRTFTSQRIFGQPILAYLGAL